MSLAFEKRGESMGTAAREGDTAETRKREAAALRQWIRKRKIHKLYHFTSRRNLESILEHGLLPVSALQARRLVFHPSDQERYEGQLGRSCLSIEHPNVHLLESYKKKFPNRMYVVLEFSSALLWKYECVFTPCNAARALKYSFDLEEFKGLRALKHLFAKQPGYWERAASTRRPWPTDDQAEVLIENHIPASSIRTIHFADRDDLLLWLRRQDVTPVPVAISPWLFAHRGDMKEKRRLKGLPDGK